jgi:hypothetical protein
MTNCRNLANPSKSCGEVGLCGRGTQAAFIVDEPATVQYPYDWQN